MITDSSPARQSPAARRADSSFPPGLWLALVLTIGSTAVWIAWPALRGVAPLDLTRLVITSALVGVTELLVLTVIEIRLAPWRFLE